jgi:hypothetical protein
MSGILPTAWVPPPYTNANAVDAVEAAVGSGIAVVTGGVLGGGRTWAQMGLDVLTANGGLLVRTGGALAPLAVGTEGQALGVVSGAPGYAYPLGAYGVQSGYAVSRGSPSTVTLAIGAGQVGRSGTTFAAGTKTAFGVTTSSATTTTTACAFGATTFDTDMTQHAFCGVGLFTGIVGSAGRRFFAGVARDAIGFACEVLTSNTPTEPTIGFFVRGGTDTTFQVLVADNSAQEFTNTTVTATNGAAYLFYYDIRESDLRVRWRIFSATDGAVPALLGSGSFTSTINPFGSTGSFDCGVLFGAKADSNAAYSVNAGDCWVIAGVMP